MELIWRLYWENTLVYKFSKREITFHLFVFCACRKLPVNGRRKSWNCEGSFLMEWNNHFKCSNCYLCIKELKSNFCITKWHFGAEGHINFVFQINIDVQQPLLAIISWELRYFSGSCRIEGIQEISGNLKGDNYSYIK